MPFADYVREAVCAPLGLALDPSRSPGRGHARLVDDVLALSRELLRPDARRAGDPRGDDERPVPGPRRRAAGLRALQPAGLGSRRRDQGGEAAALVGHADLAAHVRPLRRLAERSSGSTRTGVSRACASRRASSASGRRRRGRASPTLCCRSSTEPSLRDHGLEDERAHDRTGLRCGLVLRRVRPVEEMPAVDERRRAAAVEVDRALGAELDHHLGQLAHREPVVDARASPVARDRDSDAVRDPEGGARVAAVRDVRVELPRAGGEPLEVALASKTTGPSRTSSGPACTRSPGGSAGAAARATRRDPAVRRRRRSRARRVRFDDRLVRHRRGRRSTARRAAGTGRAGRSRR